MQMQNLNFSTKVNIVGNKIIAPTLTNCRPTLFTIRNAYLAVSFFNELFVNKIPMTVQLLAAQNPD